MPFNFQDLVDRFIRTNPQNNWGIPQDSSISPRYGMLSQLQDLIYGSESGRRLMSGVDTFNQLTGGPDIGNIAPGASHAVTPALENLVNKGVINKAADLFKEGHGSFLDKMGDVYDIGHLYDLNAMVHPEVLEMAGKAAQTPEDFLKSMDDLNVLRTRRFPQGETAIEAVQKPSNAQMEQIMALFERKPNTPVSLDLHDLSSNKNIYQHFPKANDAIEAIYNFFK